jgi:hypothetical protein
MNRHATLVGRPLPRRLTLEAAYSSAGVATLAVLLLVSYALFFAWPMRIWHRPVSPDTHLVGTLGISLAGAIVYIVAVLICFGLYGAALVLVLTRRARPSPWLVLGAAAAFCLILWPVHPLTSADVFNYIAGARVLWTHGANPLTVAPAAFADDPFTVMLRFWREIPSPYGPLWSVVAGPAVLLGGDSPLRSVLAFKALSIAFFLATAVLLFLTARRIRPDSAVPTLLAFAWNPLAVLHVAGNGHNDAVMMFFVALFLYALTRGWVAAAIVALAASALAKYATLLVGPILLVWWWRSRRRPRWSQLTLGAGLAAALSVAAYLPFWEGRETIATALDESGYFTVSIPAVVRGFLLKAVAADRAETITILASRIAFLAAFALVLLHVRGDRVDRLAESCFLAYFAYLILAATYFSPWHVLWPLTFAVLLPFRRDILWPALTLTLTSMAVLVAAVWFREWLSPDPGIDWLGMHLAAAVAVFPLPIIVWWWTLRYPAGTPVRRAALDRERRTRGSRQNGSPS